MPSVEANSPPAMQDHVDAFESHLFQYLPEFEENIRPHVAYALKNTGKCYRPLLVFLSAKNLNSNLPKVMQVAAIVEMIHCATLVHDDILDDSSFRRNVPTAKEKFGSNNAVLLGDALLAHAIYMSTQVGIHELPAKVARSTRRVCAGEIKQTLNTDPLNYSLEKYFEVIELKTAELFALSCYLGAKTTSSDADYISSFEHFGYNLGMAYQIFDDMADLLQPADELGKTPGLDIQENVLSLPILLIIESMSVPERSRWLEQYYADEFNFDYFVNSVRTLGILDEANKLFKNFITKARASIAAYPNVQIASLILVLENKMAKLA